MPGASWTQPNFETQDATSYRTAIDNCVQITERIARGFMPRENDTPSMKIWVDIGYTYKVSTGSLTAISATQSPLFVTPVTNNRIDRLIVDSTGTYSIVKGTCAADPVAPNVTADNYPVCQVLLTTSTTEITNSMITDERACGMLVVGAIGTGPSGMLRLPSGSSVSWTVPADVTTIWVTGTAGGGGSGGCNTHYTAGGGGGSGGYCYRATYTCTPGTVWSCVVGGGGGAGGLGGYGTPGGGTYMQRDGSVYLINLSGGSAGTPNMYTSPVSLTVGFDGKSNPLGVGGRGGITRTASAYFGGYGQGYGSGGGGPAGYAVGSAGAGGILIIEWGTPGELS